MNLKEIKDKNIRLIGIDLDGTMLNSEKKLSKRTYDACVNASKLGVVIIPATGRHYNAVPKEVMDIPGIRYVLGMSGAALYDSAIDNCIYRDDMEKKLAVELIEKLSKYEILIDAFVGANAYRNESDMDMVDRLAIPDKMKQFVKNSRKPVDNLRVFIEAGNDDVAKLVLNFLPDGNGGCLYRDKIIEMMKVYSQLAVVSGGLNNLEITMATANKGAGLLKFAQLLGIPKEATMAIGDAGNDADMIKEAQIGVAMANSEPHILNIADYITASNDEDGVAIVIETVCESIT